MKIKFILDSPLLNRKGVSMEWNFPVLPRKGECVFPEIIMNQSDIIATYGKHLSEKGCEDFNHFASQDENGNIDLIVYVWLYDVIAEINIVRDIQYSWDDEDYSQIMAVITLSDKEKK